MRDFVNGAISGVVLCIVIVSIIAYITKPEKPDESTSKNSMDEKVENNSTVPGKGNSIILLKNGIAQTVIPVSEVAETCLERKKVIISWTKEKCNE